MKRHVIPAILACVVVAAGSPVSAGGGTMEPVIVLIDFCASDASEWSVINDGVMGGLSRSGIQPTDHETGMFVGVLSLENNGGFASVRAAVGHPDLSAAAGLEIRVRGDGRTYQLRLRPDDSFDGIAYRTVFETRAGEWITVRRSFSDFQPTFRGRTPRDAPLLDPAHIHQVGFMLADKQPGAFSLEIDHVRTWAAGADNATDGAASLTTVDHVDLSRYVGLWHEIARIPNRFQKQCARGTTATYTRRDDGRITVVNRCVKQNGDVDEAEGIARIVDAVSNARLEVSFVSFLGWRPFWGDYWVLGLDPDYQWAAVGDSDRKYGWILARTPTLDATTLERIFMILERNGYRRDQFETSLP